MQYSVERAGSQLDETRTPASLPAPLRQLQTQTSTTTTLTTTTTTTTTRTTRTTATLAATRTTMTDTTTAHQRIIDDADDNEVDKDEDPEDDDDQDGDNEPGATPQLARKGLFLTNEARREIVRGKSETFFTLNTHCTWHISLFDERRRILQHSLVILRKNPQRRTRRLHRKS